MKTAPNLSPKNVTENAAFQTPLSFIVLEPKTTDIKSRDASLQTALLRNDDENEMARGFLMVALMLTRRCNMACAHCSVESGPRITTQPTDDELIGAVRDAAKAGAKAVQLTGGEPMLREDLVMRLLAEARALGLSATLTSNGFWGKNPEIARQKVRALSDAGVVRLTISYDRYHAEFQGAEPAVNIARAFEESNVPMVLSINFTRTQSEDLSDLVAPFDGFTKPQMRFYDVQAVGRAREFESTDLRRECEGFCTAACVPTITDDGRVTACNGPSYFSDVNSPLVIGSLNEYSMSELIEKHTSDAVLDTIRTFGPMRLRREIEQMRSENADARAFSFRDGYSGMCDLCLHINSQPQLTDALRARLSQPRLVAERVAAQRVMQSARVGAGELSRDSVNTLGACQIFFRAMTEPSPTWADDAAKIFGRADFDWNHQFVHLARCGLALPLQNALKESAFARWAPPFFIEKLRRQALNDSLRAGLQRAAMREIARACREIGARGILLKGSAMMAIDWERDSAQRDNSNIEYSNAIATRSCCDVDVFIAREHAVLVREKLLQRGFQSAPCDDLQPDEMTRLHQLPAMSYEGVLVEIHQELQPAFCGLPEREMLQNAQPLQTETMQGLWTLSADAMLLHSAVHLTKHLFAHGLKTAYDLVWLLDRFPQTDWNRVVAMARQTGLNRGFWVPFCVLCRELKIAFPAELLQQAPRDKRQFKLETVARRHLFGTNKFAFEDNPWICHALLSLMSDSWTHRARGVFGLLFGAHSRKLRRQRRQQNPQARRNRLQKLRGVWQKWRNLG